MSRAPEHLYSPRPASVMVDLAGTPRSVAGVAVEAIREEWLVEDRWWTTRPLRRRYYELVLADGRDVTVFRDSGGRWWEQRA
jgi:hypothetical protein